MTQRLHLVSDFNIDILGRMLRTGTAVLDVEVAPYNQVFQILTAATDITDAVGIVWTRPEAVVPGFNKALDFEGYELDQVLREVDLFADAVLNYAEHRSYVLVPQWEMSGSRHGHDMLDWNPRIGVKSLLATMQLHLSKRFADTGNVFVIDSQRWLDGASTVSADKMWYATKVPFDNVAFERASNDICAILYGLGGMSRRLVIVDLDDTLWGGAVGEQGWQNLRLGGHDHRGEAYSDFQKALKGLTRRGVQLAVVSKNTEDVALEAINQNPEMVLGIGDLAGWRINWSDKAQNICELADELNLGISSMVFIDDNPVERDRVRQALPEVLVPEWPKDPTHYVRALNELNCFQQPTFNDEDAGRTAMYVAERQRRTARNEVDSVDDWLVTLETTAELVPLTDSSMPRIVQLFNKTNQMNLSTRRLTEAELAAWTAQDDRWITAVRVSDRFGDSGITGIISLEIMNGVAQVIDLILSCRVMGRKVEEALISIAVEFASEHGALALSATYLPTDRNLPCLEVLKQSGLKQRGNVFTWDCDQLYARPASIKVINDWQTAAA